MKLVIFALFVVAAQGCQLYALPDAKFQTLLREINATPFSADKVDILTSFTSNPANFSGTGFSGEQVYTILKSFDFDSDQVAVITAVQPRLLGFNADTAVKIVFTPAFSSSQISTLKTIANSIIDARASVSAICPKFTFSSDQDECQTILANATLVDCVFGDVQMVGHAVVVVDVSGSMGDSVTLSSGRVVRKIDYLKQSLASIIQDGFSTTQYFNFIAFSDRASAWRPGVVPVNNANIASAVAWANALTVGGGTNMENALLLAYSDPKAEGVFLLTDGAPTDASPAQIISRAVQWSQGTKPVNPIGFFAGQFGQWMGALATATGGLFRDLH